MHCLDTTRPPGNNPNGFIATEYTRAQSDPCTWAHPLLHLRKGKRLKFGAKALGKCVKFVKVPNEDSESLIKTLIITLMFLMLTLKTLYFLG